MVDRKGLGDIENASFVCPNCGGTNARVAYELEEVEQDSKKLTKILINILLVLLTRGVWLILWIAYKACFKKEKLKARWLVCSECGYRQYWNNKKQW